MAEPSLKELFTVFGRIGLVSFGGPAAQMALMHRELVEHRDWLTEEDYLRALSFCMLLPGPEAMQLATYTGWRLKGVAGGVIAGLLFVLPGAFVILFLAAAYAKWGQLPLTQSAFLGVKAAVVVIVATSLIRLGQKALQLPAKRVTAALSFLALFLLDLPFPTVIACAALVGFVTARTSDEYLETDTKVRSPYKAAAFCAVLWAAPVITLYLSGPGILSAIAIFFSKLAVVTFGGAYAVLAYMTQATVSDFGWLTTAEMIDGLGLAETTPGPLILVTEFVGFIAAFKDGGVGLAIAGAALTLWVTFIPCFLWIFLAAGHVENLTRQPRLANALGLVTAAVVGVILNLGLWFTMNVWFTNLSVVQNSLFSLSYPQLDSLNLTALILSAVSAVLLVHFRLSLFLTLPLMATISAAISANVPV